MPRVWSTRYKEKLINDPHTYLKSEKTILMGGTKQGVWKDTKSQILKDRINSFICIRSNMTVWCVLDVKEGRNHKRTILH